MLKRFFFVLLAIAFVLLFLFTIPYFGRYIVWPIFFSNYPNNHSWNMPWDNASDSGLDGLAGMLGVSLILGAVVMIYSMYRYIRYGE